MKPEQIFERNFKKRMVNKDIESFKKTFPTLYKVIEVSLYELHNYSYCEGFNDGLNQDAMNQIDNKKPTDKVG